MERLNTVPFLLENIELKVIVRKNPVFEATVGIQLKEKVKYRFLRYLLFERVDEGVLILNLLSRELLFLSNNEIVTLNEINMLDCNLETYLIENWFLVPQDFNEYILYNQFFELYRNISKKPLNKYTIITTTDCNARCFYCYQYGVTKFNMDDSVSNAVADYIIRKYRGDKIQISWFGGEPLFNALPIDIISNKLLKANVSFNSSMISNGYLFNHETIKQAVDIWKLRKVQITLDGTEKIYNRCKAYIYEDQNPYDRVISNIQELTNNGIDVALRLNVGSHNVEDLTKLSGILATKFKGNRKIHIYAHLLFENVGIKPRMNTEEERKFLYDALYRIEELIDNNGLFKVAPLTNEYKLNACMADDYSSLVITPSGNFAKCENIVDINDLGSVFEDSINYKEIEMISERVIFSLCENCSILPHCINLKTCPTQKVECHCHEQQYRINKIKRRMIKTYEIFLKSQHFTENF